MNIGLYQSAAALSSLERWQDAVTQNITSSQVTGFKKRTVSFSSVEAGEVQTNSGQKIGQGEGTPMYFPKVSYGISFKTGEAEPTGRDLDVALNSEGFFEVKTADGSRGYTRGGSLHVRPDRTLVTAQDQEILGDGGRPIQMLPQGGKITISEEGLITQGASPLGRLSVVKFPDLKVLRPTSGGVYGAPDGVDPIPVVKPVVLQGNIESSNVTPMHEMVDLVNIARAYEANQKLIQSRDQTMQKTLDALG